MDRKKMPASKRLEDRTATNPYVAWLASQPSSQFPLTDKELEILSGGNFNINDLYFRRAVQGDGDLMVRPEYAKRQKPGDQFMVIPPPTLADPKKYKDLYGYGDAKARLWQFLFPPKQLKKR